VRGEVNKLRGKVYTASPPPNAGEVAPFTLPSLIQVKILKRLANKVVPAGYTTFKPDSSHGV
jgi:hypothetical protein